MSAKRGSAPFAVSRGLLALCMALAMLTSAAFAASASAKPPPPKTAYIALGDSIGFGYKQATFAANETADAEACAAAKTAAEKAEEKKLRREGALCQPLESYEGGFPSEFAKKLGKTERAAGHELVKFNMSCPGETSGGLIGNGELGTELEAGRLAKTEAPLGVMSPCAYYYLGGYPMRVNLNEGSELEAAVEAVKNPKVPVKAVTLQIGNNDILGVVGKCKEATYLEEHGYKKFGTFECLVHEIGTEGYAYPGGVFTHVITNLAVTVGVLRSAGYVTGKVVVFGLYNPLALKLAGSDALAKSFNEHLLAAITANALGPEVVFANPLPVFNPGSEPKVGETESQVKKHEEKAIRKYTEMYTDEDIHPTAAGAKELAKLAEAAFGI